MNTFEEQLVASTGLDVHEIAEMLAEVDALIAQTLGVVETQLNSFFNEHGAEITSVLTSIDAGVAELGAAMESFTNTDVVKEIVETTKSIHDELVGLRQDNSGIGHLFQELLMGVINTIIGESILGWGKSNLPKGGTSKSDSLSGTSKATPPATPDQSPGPGAPRQTPKRFPSRTQGISGAGRAGVAGAAVGGGLLVLEEFIGSDAFASFLTSMNIAEESIRGIRDGFAEWKPILDGIAVGAGLVAAAAAKLNLAISGPIGAAIFGAGMAGGLVGDYWGDRDARQKEVNGNLERARQDPWMGSAPIMEPMDTYYLEQSGKKRNFPHKPLAEDREFRPLGSDLPLPFQAIDQALKDFGAAITEGSYADLFSGNVSLAGRPGMLASASSHHSESVTNFNGPITVETKATDGYLLARDFRKALDAEFADIARSFDSGTY